MDKPVCKTCRHFRESRVVVGDAWCQSPCAVKVDRIRGPVYPRLGPASMYEGTQSITDKCDKEGWYEKRRPWWMF